MDGRWQVSKFQSFREQLPDKLYKSMQCSFDRSEEIAEEIC